MGPPSHLAPFPFSNTSRPGQDHLHGLTHRSTGTRCTCKVLTLITGAEQPADCNPKHHRIPSVGFVSPAAMPLRWPLKTSVAFDAATMPLFSFDGAFDYRRAWEGRVLTVDGAASATAAHRAAMQHNASTAGLVEDLAHCVPVVAALVIVILALRVAVRRCVLDPLGQAIVPTKVVMCDMQHHLRRHRLRPALSAFGVPGGRWFGEHGAGPVPSPLPSPS